jgi:type 1 fimbria pilin
MNPVKLLPGLGVLLGLSAGMPTAALAQSEGWMLGPGSRVDQSSEVVPTNCSTASDGSITCDTELKPRTTGTPARPNYNPFND